VLFFGWYVLVALFYGAYCAYCTRKSGKKVDMPPVS
jgi:hypothetical protein